MKRILFAIIFITSVLPAFAAHVVGGEMIYEYLGLGTAPNTKKYSITLKLYRDQTSTGAAMPPSVDIGIYNKDNGSEFAQCNVDLNVGGSCNVPKSQELQVPVNSFPPCVTNAPTLDYHVGFYQLIVELPDNVSGYSATYQTCCRVTNLLNVNNPGLPSQGTGSTYTCDIPPFIDNAPQFSTNVSLICAGKHFTFDFSAIDPDGDSLAYVFAAAYDRGNAINSANVNPSPPPYAPVTYIGGYTDLEPLGPTANLNPSTGMIYGIAPVNPGKYVVCVSVKSYRNGVYIGEHRKDFIVNVGNCDFTGAQLDPRPVTCDGFNVSFSNNGDTPADTSWHWTFGDPVSGPLNFSTLQYPTHQYSDTGVYLVKLVVNQGSPCADSATQVVRVYPGFFPGFIWTGQCINTPIHFTDTSHTNYGVINAWRWDFGDPSAAPGDTSHSRNPNYTYSAAGNYPVTLIVSNSKGCTDTVTTLVPIISNPTINMLFRDTTYCGLDTIQLQATASGSGTYSWTPLTNIINPNSPNPLVFPTTTTIYRVTFDAGGCTKQDSVIVRPKLDLAATVSANPSNICEEDTTTLKALSNHLPVTYLWSPAASLATPVNQSTLAYPSVTTTYTVTVRWGNNCITSGSKTINVKQLAIPVAGPPQAICAGGSGAQLNASGGNNYQWSPPTGLNNINIPNPLAKPLVTTIYTVSIGVTGCAKRRSDSVQVTVRSLPSITKTNDTLICSIDTLQLNANGNGTFFWTPNYRISNQSSPSPLVSPQVPTTYYVTLTDQFGCTNRDSVFVNVKQVVSLDAGPDLSICLNTPVQLQPISDALHYKWTPSGPLNNDTAKYPIASNLGNGITTFYVIANIGKCQSTDSVKVKVAPFPVARVSPDTSICFGGTVQLSASGGSLYSWSPIFFLDNPNISNPVANPNTTYRYTVTVRDTLGCGQTDTASVLVKVFPKLLADAGPRDTSIVRNQPLQLFGSGGQIYLWSPTTGLTNPNAQNPIARGLTDNIDYILKVSNAAGCFSVDTISVTVYKVNAGLYVPNAFTPNGDGKNDKFRPIPIGMKQINYFKVFNRWGQLIFSTTDQLAGWDGNYKGHPQDPAVYVWIVEGIDFNDIKITQKGTMVLIR